MKSNTASGFSGVAGSLTRLSGIAAVALLATTVAGCKSAHEGSQVAGWNLVDPAQRHPIMVSQEPSTLTLNVPAGSTRLSPTQRADLLDFTARYRAADAGNSRLVISAPSGSQNEVSAMSAVQEVRSILTSNGFSESDISVEAYLSEGSAASPLRISYLRYVAQGPECGHWSTNLARQPDNLNHPNMGCATQKNFAAMVSNPADLLGPRTVTARGSERREVAWDKYVKGDVTTSAKTDDEKVDTRSGN